MEKNNKPGGGGTGNWVWKHCMFFENKDEAVWNAWSSKDPNLEPRTCVLTISKHMLVLCSF